MIISTLDSGLVRTKLTRLQSLLQPVYKESPSNLGITIYIHVSEHDTSPVTCNVYCLVCQSITITAAYISHLTMTMKHCGKHHRQQSNMYSKLVHLAYQTVSDSHYESKQTQTGNISTDVTSRWSTGHHGGQRQLASHSFAMCPHKLLFLS